MWHGCAPLLKLASSLCLPSFFTPFAPTVLVSRCHQFTGTQSFPFFCQERRRPEDVLYYAVSNLDPYLPSIASIKGEVFDMMICTVRMLGEFNFAQLLQGENNPHSVWQLQSARKDKLDWQSQVDFFSFSPTIHGS